MVLAGKFFVLEELSELNLLAAKLKGYFRKEVVKFNDREMELVTEIKGLAIKENMLQGIFSRDYVISTIYRGDISMIPATRESTFVFTRHADASLLFVSEKKERANNIASRLSGILFIDFGGIVEANITHKTLKAFHESSPEATKVIFFDEVDLPNVNKLSLYGLALTNTSLYNEYLKHGKIWYVVFESKKHGYVIGLTRNCVITVFSKINENRFIDYVMEEILPLVEIQ